MSIKRRYIRRASLVPVRAIPFCPHWQCLRCGHLWDSVRDGIHNSPLVETVRELTDSVPRGRSVHLGGGCPGAAVVDRIVRMGRLLEVSPGKPQTCPRCRSAGWDRF